MMLEDLLGEKRSNFVEEILRFSDLSPRQLRAARKSVEARLRKHWHVYNGASFDEMYEMASEVLISMEKSGGDALTGARSLDASLKEGSNFSLYHVVGDMAVPYELLTEGGKLVLDGNREQRLWEFDEAMEMLRERLSPKEYKYLINLMNVKPEFVLANLRITPEYVAENIGYIKGKIQLAARLFPRVTDIAVTEQLSMEQAVETYVIGTYKQVLTGMIKIFPHGFFQQEAERRARVLTRFLAEDMLDLSLSEIPKVAKRKMFIRHKLGGMLTNLFGRSSVRVIENAYPGMFMAWEYKDTKRWQAEEGRQRGIEAVKWLVEEKMDINPSEIPQVVDKSSFIENGLDSMLIYCFGGSPYEAIEATYPGMFMPWEMKNTPYWTDENRYWAIRWLIEDKLGWHLSEVPERIGEIDLKKYGLNKMVYRHYPLGLAQAIMDTYPELFIYTNPLTYIGPAKSATQ